jgi:hypothetical protein
MPAKECLIRDSVQLLVVRRFDRASQYVSVAGEAYRRTPWRDLVRSIADSLNQSPEEIEVWLDDPIVVAPATPAVASP